MYLSLYKIELHYVFENFGHNELIILKYHTNAYKDIGCGIGRI